MTPDPRNVAVEYVEPRYPDEPPFHPHERYPEYDGPLGPENEVYAGVRQLFIDLGLDSERAGTPDWNPLGDLIRPGQQVLVKPSIVLDRNLGGGAHDAVVTHGSLVRAVCDYALKALAGKGRLVVGDAPVQQCDFELANERSGVKQVMSWYAEAGTPVDLLDFRFVVSAGDRSGVRREGTGDPAGFVFADLGAASMHREPKATGRFAPTHYDLADEAARLRVTNYDPAFMRRHHGGGKHEYIIAATALESDVIISLPKLKTHRKVGLTVALKNLIGINGHKDCLPHHAQGSLTEGGDEYRYPSLLKRLHTRVQEFEDVQPSRYARYAIKVPKRALFKLAKRFAPDPYFEGSWWGNDTLWRTVIDINRILLHWDARKRGLAQEQQRALFSIVDGIVAGEREGPLQPAARDAGLLLAGISSPAVDLVCARIVGFDWKRLPLLRKAFTHLDAPRPEDIRVFEQGKEHALEDLREIALIPPRGWEGHVRS